jgi:hypothetical protein
MVCDLNHHIQKFVTLPPTCNSCHLNQLQCKDPNILLIEAHMSKLSQELTQIAHRPSMQFFARQVFARCKTHDIGRN